MPRPSTAVLVLFHITHHPAVGAHTPFASSTETTVVPISFRCYHFALCQLIINTSQVKPLACSRLHIRSHELAAGLMTLCAGVWHSLAALSSLDTNPAVLRLLRQRPPHSLSFLLLPALLFLGRQLNVRLLLLFELLASLGPQLTKSALFLAFGSCCPGFLGSLHES